MDNSRQPPPPGPDRAALAALALHQAGDLAGAHRAYQELLRDNAAHPYANLWMAALLHQTGRTADAERYAQTSVEAAPTLPDAWVNLGIIRRALGQAEAARSSLERALSLDPLLDAAWLALGATHQELDNDDDAERAYERAASLAPKSPLPDFNRATLHLERGRVRAAQAAVENALAKDSSHAASLGLLATCQLELDEPQAALATLQRAERLDHNNPDLPAARGAALAELGQLEAAVAAFDRALRLKPDHGPALSTGLFTRRRLCHWAGIERVQARFRDALSREVAGLAPFPWLAEDSTRAEQQRCARQWGAQWPDRPLATQPHISASGERLTVAYLSADYYRHPTAYLAAGLFEAHDRARFRILGYSNSRDDGSDIRARVVSAFDEFVDIRKLDAEAVAAHMQRERVDILVDLKGHTLEASTAVLARRSAPIQVQYLGYPGTMGMACVDYLIGDPVVTPFEHQDAYDEFIVQLPHSYQINDQQRPHPEAADDGGAHGLPGDAVVYCCFNNTWKFNEPAFRTWLDVLSAVPDSVLWLLGRESSASVAARLREIAGQAGIAPERLVFSKSRPLTPYLSLFHHADLFLDSWPYNAHTTASDALWMGCPVLTIQGETFAGRVGASLLKTSGLEALVCQGINDYREAAIALGQDRSQLQALRRSLERGRDTNRLFDTRATTRSIEAAFEEMARRHRDGNPGPFKVPH